jgi:hypothetical protein
MFAQNENGQRMKLDGAEIPSDLTAETRHQLRDAIDRPFTAALQRTGLVISQKFGAI